MLKRGDATGYREEDLLRMFETCIANMSIDDMKTCYVGEKEATEDYQAGSTFIVTHAELSGDSYFTFVISRVKLNDTTILYSVTNQETRCEVLSITMVGGSWTCNRGHITRSRTIDVFKHLYEVL